MFPLQQVLFKLLNRDFTFTVNQMGNIQLQLHGYCYMLSIVQMGGHGVFVGSGGGMPQPRGMHQPGMHPMNPSPGLRAQVPHQFLSAQVCCRLCLIVLVTVS